MLKASSDIMCILCQAFDWLMLVFKITQETAGSKTSLLLFSVKIREKQTWTWACLSIGVMGPEISWTFFMLIIDFFIFWVIKYYGSPFSWWNKSRAFYKRLTFLKGLLCLKSWWDHFTMHISKLGWFQLFPKIFKLLSCVILWKLACPQTTIFWL